MTVTLVDERQSSSVVEQMESSDNDVEEPSVVNRQEREQPSSPEYTTAALSTIEERRLRGIYATLHRFPRVYKTLMAWPRLWSLFLGVVLPLFFLIGLSIFFGLLLARAESPNEIAQNDALLAEQALAELAAVAIGSVTALIPSLCFQLFALGRPIENFEDLLWQSVLQNTTVIAENDLVFGGGISLQANSSEMFLFMQDCGRAAADPVKALLSRQTASLTPEYAPDLTFNWIRCLPGASGIFSGGPTAANLDRVVDLQPAAQTAFFMATWRNDQEILNKTYYAKFLSTMTPFNATLEALRTSIQHATGGSACEVNRAASGWFWFTILSTVGYGNQAPATRVGKALVYTAGFISILAFAGILATAGYIASAVWDDMLVRLKLRFFAKDWVSCIIWGCFYYIWMVVIAASTKAWKITRMGETDFTMSDGYWFSYISSTTVGLGDIYLEPEGLLYRDLISFSLLLLVGFVLVSAFLGKLDLMVRDVIGKRSLVEEMIDQLHKSDLLFQKPMVHFTDSVQGVTESAIDASGNASSTT